MKTVFLNFFTILILIGCSSEDSLDVTIYNSELSIIQNLDNGVSVLNIVSELGVEALYGIEFGGGYIFHVDVIDGTTLVATDYSDFGIVAWGDIFDLDTSPEIGSGLNNTQQIVDGNGNDNSANGIEHDGEYAFKIVLDLEYRNFDDWFIPSRDSMQAIYDNVHLVEMGNFSELLTYWTSTKVGYSPYVMNFDFDWGGIALPGLCTNANGIISW